MQTAIAFRTRKAEMLRHRLRSAPLECLTHRTRRYFVIQNPHEHMINRDINVIRIVIEREQRNTEISAHPRCINNNNSPCLSLSPFLSPSLSPCPGIHLKSNRLPISVRISQGFLSGSNGLLQECVLFALRSPFGIYKSACEESEAFTALTPDQKLEWGQKIDRRLGEVGNFEVYH